MPIFFQQEIDSHSRLAIWKIEEAEEFFSVPLQREITHPHKRLQHLAGRYLLKKLFPDFPLELIKIADTRKPYLENESYHFSISHCSDFAAVIVSKNKRVGVDIEVPTFKVEKIKHKFLHPEELAMVNGEWSGVSGEKQVVNSKWRVEEVNKTNLQQDPSPNRRTPNSKLTLLWSAKEAVFKWWSYGGVDFSEMIRLQPFQLQPSGMFAGKFCSAEKDWPLKIHYKMFNDLCLAWVV